MSETRGRWGILLAEAALIVVSILMAFAIDAWWDERGTRQLRTRTLTGVRADFERNNAQLQQWIGVNRRIVRNSDLLLNRLEAAAPGDPVAVSDTLLAAAVLIPTYDPTRGSVDALIASGNLSLIRNPELRSLLPAWEGFVQDVAEDEARVAEIEADQIVPALARQASLRRVYAELLPWSVGEASAAFRSSSSTLRPDAVLQGLLAHRRWRVETTVGGMEELLSMQRRIISLIDEELAR